MNPEVYREMAALQHRHWWFVARRRVLSAVLDSLCLPADARILEIGCGPGGNLPMLAARGRLQAMEYDADAVAVARASGVCAVVHGGLPEPVPFADQSFDLVCLFDVLEHIDDDQAALARVARLLAPGGRLLLTVPAYAWLWSAHDTAHHHRRRYTAGQLRARAARAGLSVHRLGYFNSLLLPMIAGVRLASRLAGRQGGSDAALPSPRLNRLLGGIFGLEAQVAGRWLFPAGTSVVGVFGHRMP